MDTGALKKFAQEARRQLLEQVAARMEQVLQVDSVEIREKAGAVEQLREQIVESSKEAVIDRVAYTWFNRFCALRYMDVNHYTRMGVVSPQESFTQPEILAEAKQGVIDDSFKVDQTQIIGLLNGQIPAANPQQEAYQLLLVGVCSAYHAKMPFLFPEIEDYTALLMPEDLLSEKSILHAVRLALDEAACQDVEVIGWLYQYYISERKDEVIGSKQKIKAEDIPAATQLFTPHWIVRYLVENSLGRLWMLNHPDSGLVEQMDYYIQPEEPETDFLRVDSPEELKICDPACGSGHMLTYAFDLLYVIYEEQGYDPVQIPQLILEKNLFGIEIDQRAGHLAAFALTMKARQRDRRFFRRGVEPNICVLRNVSFTTSEIDEYMDAVGRDLFTQDLWLTLRQFEQAENTGSLIRPALKDVNSIRERLEEKGVFDNLFLHNTNQKVEQVLEMAEFLGPRFHVVIANPPYMGSKGMNGELKDFSKDFYPDSKSDTYTMFMERNLSLVLAMGLVGMITIPNWMYIKTYENFRRNLLASSVIVSLIDNGRGVWGSDFGSCSFVLSNFQDENQIGKFKRLYPKRGKVNSNSILKRHFFDNTDFPFYYASAVDFKMIPGTPIVYWANTNDLSIFSTYPSFGSRVETREGLTTGSNDTFLRYWFEVLNSHIGFSARSEQDTFDSNHRWFQYVKGGSYRKWYGNHEYVVDWEKNGARMKCFSDQKTGRIRSHNYNGLFAFREGFTWSGLSMGAFSVRYVQQGFMFDAKGPMGFPNEKSNTKAFVAYLNSKITHKFMTMLSPTMDFKLGHVLNLPFALDNFSRCSAISDRNIELSRIDWNAFETSWGFSTLPLVSIKTINETLPATYANLYRHWQTRISEMRYLEVENNQIFIDAYGLQDELSPNVPLSEITLTCNPNYRYPNTKRRTYTEEEREALLLADTMKEFISHAAGCMFGRYSLDTPGLILANQGETLRDYLNQIPEPSFPADDDNVIPVLDEGWFDDDIVERFKRFLRVTFGDEHYEENLAFLENAIGKNIRSYFLRDFYKEHVKMYKKRPIYWLFSSPKGSFNALIYMHRYRPDTVSIILNDYLREYREKISAQKAHLEAVERDPNASQGEKTKALREIDKIDKVLAELREYEDEILYPLATRQIDIDLDDGVKVNYPKFGVALKKVSGLSQ